MNACTGAVLLIALLHLSICNASANANENNTYIVRLVIGFFFRCQLQQTKQITNQPITEPNNGFVLLTAYYYAVGMGKLQVNSLSVNASEIPTTLLAVFYDYQWAEIDVTSSCAQKLANTRALYPVPEIINTIKSPQSNGTWTLNISDTASGHIWFVAVANCELGHISAFQWSAELSGPPGSGSRNGAVVPRAADWSLCVVALLAMLGLLSN